MRSSKIWPLIVGATMAYGVAGVSTPAVSLARPMQVTIPETSDTLNGLPETDTTAALQMAYRADQQNLDPSVDAEINRRFNELRRELLDDRASTINWWLAMVALVLTFFAIVVPIAALFGFREFREIKKEAREAIAKTREATEKAEESANKARHHAKEAEKDQGAITEKLQNLTAENVANDPFAAKQAEAVSKDPQASLMDKAVARAISLQKEGKTEEAIKKWRCIACATEGVDNDFAVDAWFSIGYLLSQLGGVNKDKIHLEKVLVAYDQVLELNPYIPEAYSNRGAIKGKLGQYEEAIADCSRALELNPNYAVAYSNRGGAKSELGQYEAAIADCNRALKLNPNYALAYSNRGEAKAGLGRIAEARVDFEKARDIAKNAGDEKTVSKAEENLRKLENGRKA